MEASLQGPDEPYDRKARGSSRPAIPDTGLLFLDDNREVGDALASIVRQLDRHARERGVPTVAGETFSTLMDIVWQDPAAVRNWEAATTGRERSMRSLFSRFSLLIATALEARRPGAWVEVVLPGRGRRGKVAETPRESAAFEREAAKRAGYARAEHLRYAGLVALAGEYPEATRGALKEMWARRRDMSPATARDAMRFAERHEWADGRPVEPHLRYRGEMLPDFAPGGSPGGSPGDGAEVA